MKKIYLAFCLLVSITSGLYAQQAVGRLIDVDFKQAGIKNIVTVLKTKTGFNFYYDPAQFDSLKVTIIITQKTLSKVLDEVFEGSRCHYVITEDQDVILTRNWQINTDLAAGFFSGKKEPSNAGTSISDLSLTTEQQKVIESTSENKLYTIGSLSNANKTGNVSLAGYIRNINSGEAISGASVYEPVTHIGIATNQFGYYSISLPRGQHNLIIKAAAMKDTHRKIALYMNGEFNVEMQEQIISLKEVKISVDKVANVRSVEMGVSKLDIKSIKQFPTVFGEADVLRVVLTLPGVQTVGEASTGFNVRGGSADQNLILLNGSTIYNPSHFFGFFSAFDPDIIQDVELYKSIIPEKFGGRLSSVLDISEREGNNKKFTGTAGIGLLTSRFNIEGPLAKNKTSFILGARTTYADWLLKTLPSAYKNSSASFYDINLNISHHINDNNSLFLSTYMSSDGFKLNSDTSYKYGNRNMSLKWKHNFSNKLFSVIMGGYDKYQYSISSNVNPVDAYQFNFDINQINFKTDLTYYINSKNTISFGVNSIRYKIDPGSNQPFSAKSQVTPDVVPAEQALESALYLGDKYAITTALSVSAGIRYAMYNYLGPQTVNHYVPGLPRTLSDIADSVKYGSGSVINTYHGPEIRASVRYLISSDFSVKAAFNTLRQYIHLLSNTTAISPMDIWKLSDPNIKPQFGNQISMGIYKNFGSNTIETSVEAYYKHLENYLDYRSGAVLVLNKHIETDAVSTQGKAYGIEFLIKKATGQLNGWVSYTYSRIFLKQNDPGGGIPINNGEYYPANYDKPNNFNFVGNYRFSHRYSVSFNSVYSTGRPITYPIGEYYYGGSERVLYSKRNQYRIPDYFRTDLSVNIDGNHKVHQFFHSSWTIGVYNLTGRNNAYSTFFTEQGGGIQGYKLSVFANPIPFVNYNIRF
ncbi:TonB-dependent receptor [uncultured Mucilaginibacter sp.]|uniref:TonB-dependent receptor n=1 Tax=uncultured Mucilaginibacter sp. TaxID=797541 RepID=UPI0025E405C8|nr:TonB-dependent receptor [uncultured Mucilaginibacter sp.]